MELLVAVLCSTAGFLFGVFVQTKIIIPLQERFYSPGVVYSLAFVLVVAGAAVLGVIGELLLQ